MQKIAILGGGVGALTTAMELTNDPDWQQRYDITIYQLGWRLGGKGASGRNRDMADRIQEHGIHLWMGFYENAFHMIRRAYAEAHQKRLMPQSPFTDARKAFSPMNYSPLMELYDGQWKMWQINWPPNGEFPGEDTLFEQKLPVPTPWELSRRLMTWVRDELDARRQKHPKLSLLYEFAAGELAGAIGSAPPLPDDAVPAVEHTLLHRIAAFADLLPHEAAQHSPETHAQLAGWLKRFLQMLVTLVADELEQDDEFRRFIIVVETALAALIGMVEDGVLTKGFMAIEDEDFIDWLTRHGCHQARSPLTIGMYDACFAYRKGEVTGMKMGAGSTLYGALRLMFTYKGALMWWMNAGMGETIMSPLYLVLRSRGVKFRFFHKVTKLHVTGTRIGSIDLEVQATPKSGEYEPLFTATDGIPCWPSEPFWKQLAEAEQIQKCKNHDLESWWSDWHGAPATLRAGQDYDLVVLGISLGAHPYTCQELVESDKTGGWRNMLANVETVRTQALQLWMNRTPAQAGWQGGPPVLASYTEPFDTWSDMSHLIPHENWPAAYDVRQIAYFCNVIPDDAQAPFSDPTYPDVELQRVRQYSRAFVDGALIGIWPGAALGPGRFNDSILVNCSGDPSRPPFETQFFRVNVDPTELYVLSLPGTARHRLQSGDSRFDNLYLAGDWTFTDLNIGCIEAAVISGRMCSRAISGKPDHIYAAFGSEIPIVRGAVAK
jgi:uncharacterized protein with NAD-binding domain and iron-sulfur cluster